VEDWSACAANPPEALASIRHPERKRDRLCFMSFTIDAPSVLDLGDPCSRLSVAERCRTTRLFSACQTSGTYRSELPNWERTCQMITLTRDLNVFTSCITTDLPAVFFSIHDVAQARNMCAHSCILFRHFLLLCSYSDPLHPDLQTPTPPTLGFCEICVRGECQRCCTCRQADSSVGIWTARTCDLY
jgi:hypothetical protein